ncbi:hypothetical protein GA0115255_109711, partial [Streptomyces sp. Ncost-T6T-2b]
APVGLARRAVPGPGDGRAGAGRAAADAGGIAAGGAGVARVTARVVCARWVRVRMVVDRLIPLPGADTEERRVARTLPCRGWTALRRSKLRITELWARAETPEGFAFRMSISSSDRTVMPENVDNDQLAELVESAVTEAPAGATAPAAEKTEEAAEAPVAAETPEAEASDSSEASAEPTVTFGDLGLPEGIVRKLAQNGVTTPSRSRRRPSRTPWPARTSSAVAVRAPARPSPSVCPPWPRWPVAAPRRRSPAPSSSPRPVSSRCRSRTRSSRTATCSA